MTAWTSADFLGLMPDAADGAGGDIFADDMHDVPLHSSRDVKGKRDSGQSPQAPVSRALLHKPPHIPFPYHQQQLQVCVHSPEKVPQTTLAIPTSYTAYTVDTKSSPGSDFPVAACSVKRRFSDFAALHEALVAQYAGYFVPPLPDKDLIQAKVVEGKFFILTRTQDLEIFINRCCDHEMLRVSKALHLFLTLACDSLLANQEWQRVEKQERIFSAFRLAQEVSAGNLEASAPRPPSSTLGKVSASIATTFWHIGKQVQSHVPSLLSSSPEEGRRRHSGDLAEDGLQYGAMRLLERATEYHSLIARWSQCAHAIDAVGVALEGLALDLMRLQHFEDRAAKVVHPAHPPKMRQVLTSHFKKTAYTTMKVSRGFQEYAKTADRALLPLKHVDSGLRAGQRAYNDRHQLFLAMQAAKERAQDKREKHHIYSNERNGSEARSDGLDEMQRNATKLEESAQVLRKDYDTVAALNREERDRVAEEAAEMAPLAVRQLAQFQVSLLEGAADAWIQLAENLGADVSDL